MSHVTEQDLSAINILIIRTSAIGDVIMASPLVLALKKKYPNSKISWLAEPHISELIEHNPDIHQVIPIPKSEFKQLWQNKNWFTLAAKIRAKSTELKQQNFDLVVDVQGLFKSGIWAKLSGAKRRVGFKSKEGSALLLSEAISKPADDPDISSEYKTMAQYLGCPTSQFEMNVHVPEVAQTTVTCKLLELQLSNYVAICPFTTRAQKHWFDDYWQKLAEQFFKVFGLRTLIVGGPADKTHAQKIVGDRQYMFDVCGELGLLESIELLSRANITIGVDTGMTHGSIAKGTPTIALFGSTRPYLNTFAQQSEVLYLNKSCSPCRRRPTCGGEFSCLRDITPAFVFNRAKQLIHQSEPLRLV